MTLPMTENPDWFESELKCIKSYYFLGLAYWLKRIIRDRNGSKNLANEVVDSPDTYNLGQGHQNFEGLN